MICASISILLTLFEILEEVNVWPLNQFIQIARVHRLISPQPIEKIVGGARDEAVTIATIRAMLTHGAVIEVVPLASDRILSVGCVVTASHATKVIRDTEAIVEQVVRVTLLWHQNEGSHVKTLEREIDECVNLLPSEAISTLRCLEAL